MPTTKIEIGTDEILNNGDVVEYHFEWITNNTWVRAAQVALIENKLRARPDLELISSSYLGKDLVLRIEHIDTQKEAGLGTKISVGFMQGTIMAVGAGGFLFSGVKKAYKLTKTVARATVEIAKYVTTLGPVQLGLIAAVAVYFLLRIK